ncbi:MAG: CPBP family intramembrane glutamic endopeptidase [bacterium]
MSTNSTATVRNQSLKWKHSLTAVLEVFGVYMVGQLIAFILIKLLQIDVVNPIEVLKANPDADLLEMSQKLGVILLLQYGGIMVPALLIGWWHRRRRLSDYGWTTAKRPLFHNVWIGIVLFTVAGLPGRLLEVVDRFIIPLGEKAITHEVIYALNWDFKFWIFMAVGSYLLIPFVEEFFYRGYVQTRLAEDFDAPAAILITALFFTFSHSQYYLTLSAWTIGFLLTTLFTALAWGYIFFRTRSLIAPIIAHALVNIPVRGAANIILPVVMIAVVVSYRKQIIKAFKNFAAIFKTSIFAKWETVVVSLGVIIFTVLIAVAQDIAVLFGIVFLFIALVLEFFEKRKKKK